MNSKISTFLALFLGLSAPLVQAQQEEQEFLLSSGWNLIAFQVLPANPAPSSVFASGTVAPVFRSAWTYEADSKVWKRYVKSSDSTADANGVPGLGLSDIQVGKAYWVHLSNVPASPWKVTGTIPKVTQPLAFSAGWNMFGIPAGAAKVTERVSMLSVLTQAGFDYDTILQWEAGKATPIYEQASPGSRDTDGFQFFDPSRGYWVHVKDPAVLRPTLLSSVREDVDAEPQGNYPSFEDKRYSRAAAPLNAQAQTHIVFEPGEDHQRLSITNTGGGIMVWSATWVPTDKADLAEPWMTLASTVSDQSSSTQLQGVTTIENDIVYLRLDRKNLPSGMYRGRIELATSAGDRSIEVEANVPGIQGEWRGLAVVDTVNGKSNRPPDIDLHMSLFEDAKSPGLLRGVIDSAQALMWPVDVPLIGHVNSNGDAFSIGGGFVLPPGDQNLPPFSSQSGKLGAEDVDWDNDGDLDATNPFPFAIQREVFFEGKVVAASPQDGYKIEGQYIEVVHGMLRKAIRVLGSFMLTRENSEPFASRLGEEMEGVRPTTFVAKARFGSGVTPPSTRGAIIDTEMELFGVSVNVKTSGDIDPTKLSLSLRAPDGRSLLLFDRQDVTRELLADITFPADRKPVGNVPAFISSVGQTKGTWTLEILNTGSGGRLESFDLVVTGQPVFDVYGRVLTGLTGVPAQVSLAGAPVNASVESGADGKFTIRRLPGIPLNFSAEAAGFGPQDPDNPGTAPFNRLPVVLSPAAGEETRLEGRFRPLPSVPVAAVGVDGFQEFGTEAKPFVVQLRPLEGTSISASQIYGFAPLYVDFTAVGLQASARWEFGDGQTSNLSTVEHVFTAPGVYEVKLKNALGAVVGSRKVVAMPSPGNATAATNVFHAHFHSGGALPANVALPQGQLIPQRPDLVTIQQTYAASFDIDLAPFTRAGSRAFGSDGFSDPLFTGDAANRSALGFKDEDHNYSLATGNWSDQVVWRDENEIPPNDNLAVLAGYSADDENFDPHPKVPNNAGVPTTHYRMTCTIGAPILPLPATLAPPGESGIAENRSLKLITGPFASDWEK